MTGFDSKRKAALDEEGMYLVHQTDHSEDILQMVAQPAQAEQCNYPDCKCPTENPCLKGLAQPAQEPPPWWPAVENILTEYGLQAIDFVADFNAALARRERNFCERCGKRTADLTTIHTCTPPQEQST
jgi:hypothetical protein